MTGLGLRAGSGFTSFADDWPGALEQAWERQR